MMARHDGTPMIARKRTAAMAGAIMVVVLAMVAAQAQQHESGSADSSSADRRQLVRFPEPMRLHTMANMRDHLRSLQEIDVALARGDFDKAASIAESRLGLSSLEAHGASHLAPYMPKGMQETGSNMHRAASRFAVEAQNASESDDVKPALAALANVMEQCVACHATYRLH
jgi:cytochrome c556